MDNQQNNQEPVNQTPVNQVPPINPEPVTSESIPVPETPIQSEPEVTNTEPVELPPQPEMEITPEPEITPEAASTSNDYQQVLDQYAANTEKLPPIETPPRSTEEQLQNLGITTPPKTGGGFLKVLFIIALIIFIFVVAAFTFVYFKSQKTTDNSDSSNFDTVKTTPTSASGSCFLNDKTYQIGESFASADGCNTCSCESQDVITCTEKACITILTITPTVTPVSTISAKKTTPTATPSAAKN